MCELGIFVLGKGTGVKDCTECVSCEYLMGKGTGVNGFT
jgi:hypothetical protein